MTAKLQNYIQLAGKTVAQVTKNHKNRVVFLNTASRICMTIISQGAEYTSWVARIFYSGAGHGEMGL